MDTSSSSSPLAPHAAQVSNEKSLFSIQTLPSVSDKEKDKADKMSENDRQTDKQKIKEKRTLKEKDVSSINETAKTQSNEADSTTDKDKANVIVSEKVASENSTDRHRRPKRPRSPNGAEVSMDSRGPASSPETDASSDSEQEEASESDEGRLHRQAQLTVFQKQVSTAEEMLKLQGGPVIPPQHVAHPDNTKQGLYLTRTHILKQNKQNTRA